MAVGDGSAPKPAAKAGPSTGRGPPREKDVLVAAGEVVGRPLAVWSQKLLDWPKAVVASYRSETQEHLIRYEDPAAAGVDEAEKWVRLGGIRFQWLSEQPEGARANPTAAGAPRGDDCVGRRLKVFWPGMGRWYQGKVQSYDHATGRHCIRYRDGDVQELRLCHEAIIWVDVGRMPPRPPSAQQQGQQQQARAGAGKPPAKAASPTAAREGCGSGASGRGRSPAAQQKAAALPPVLSGPAAAAAARASLTAAAKRPRTDAGVESSSGDERLRSNKSSATREGGLAAAAATPGAASAPNPRAAPGGQGAAAVGGAGVAAGGGSSNMGSAYSGQSLEEDAEGDPGAGSSSEGASDGEEDEGDSSVATDDLGSEVYSSDLGEEADSDFEVESARSAGARPGAGRRRPGAGAGTGMGRSAGLGRKRSRGARSSKRNKKGGAGRPRKGSGGAGGQDRQGRPRRDSGRAVSFRAKPVARDEEAARMAGGSVVGARVAVLWVQDGRYYKGKLLQFDSYHKRSKILYDDGEEEWISLSRETFKWLTPRGRSAGYAGEMREALAQLAPQPAPPGAPSPAGGSPTPAGEVANVALKGPPKGDAAVGWQVSVLFEGDGQWYRGEVLGFDLRTGRHLLLYDDGEEEWLVLDRERVAWHKLARGAGAGAAPSPGGSPALCPGLQPGLPAPRGRTAVGWRVGVFWPADLAFYCGEISAFDPASGRHTVSYDDGDVRTVCLGVDKIKWILPPGAVVDASKLGGVDHADVLSGGGAGAARARGPRKGNGIAGESDPDYEFERRPAMRRLPRLLTTASLAGAAAGLEPGALHQLPAEASVAQLLHPLQGANVASPYWGSPGSTPFGRSSGAVFQMPLSPTTEHPLGEAVLVRQVSRVPALGSFSSSESEATQLPAPITVRIYMSCGGRGGAGSGGGSGSGSGGDQGEPAQALQGAGLGGGAAAEGGAGAGCTAGPGGAQQRPGALQGPAARLHTLNQMARRVVRAKHTLVKGVPTHLPPRAPATPAIPGPLSPPQLRQHGQPLLHQHPQHRAGHQHQQQQQQLGLAGGLHRLARTSTADPHHPLSPVHRRPHPALSDEEASSSGSSDDESEREASPAALLSPRSAAALNGAKIKPDAQPAQQAQRASAGPDPMGMDVDLLLGTGGTVTPCDSDVLGPVPPLVPPAPQQLDSPFSAGGLLRSGAGAAAGAAAQPPSPVYSGKPLFPDAPACGSGGGVAAAAAAAAMPASQGMGLGVGGGSSGGSGEEGDGSERGAAAPLAMARSMSLTGAMLDGIALPPPPDPIGACQLLGGMGGVGGPSRNDSEFNLLAMGTASEGAEDLAPMDALMELDEVAGVVVAGSAADAMMHA